MKGKKTLLTEEGLKELQDELDELINVKRPANLKAIKEARALGDLSENADYDAAKNDQAELEGRIKKIERNTDYNERLVLKALKKAKEDGFAAGIHTPGVQRQGKDLSLQELLAE